MQPMHQPSILRSRSAAGVPLPFPPSHSVRFPSSPGSLARTFSAHSAAHYDRSPIQVSSNECELPARGCPGRTYYDGANPKSGHVPKHLLAGKALHPRALAAYETPLDDPEDDDSDADLQRTPTRTSPYIALPVQPPIPGPYAPYTAPNYPSYLVPPPLIADLSSSSDESDGFASPPPEPAFYGGPTKYPQFGYPHSLPQPVYAMPPSSSKRRSRKSPPRHPRVEDGYEEEDLPGSISHAGAFTTRRPSMSPPRDRAAKKPKDKDGRSRKEKCGVAALCRSLTGAGFRDENEGCLGGF